ncbi:hypothetical protein DMH17_13375 [Raoultella planticola]|nr:hypothetical protein [Raoultella planticola]
MCQSYFGAQRWYRRQQSAGALRWAESGAPVPRSPINAVLAVGGAGGLFNQQVSIRLKPEFNQVVDGDALQLAGRGSWFVATPEERAQCRERVVITVN